jgi:hypothetical protein
MPPPPPYARTRPVPLARINRPIREPRTGHLHATSAPSSHHLSPPHDHHPSPSPPRPASAPSAPAPSTVPLPRATATVHPLARTTAAIYPLCTTVATIAAAAASPSRVSYRWHHSIRNRCRRSSMAPPLRPPPLRGYPGYRSLVPHATRPFSSV